MSEWKDEVLTATNILEARKNRAQKINAEICNLGSQFNVELFIQLLPQPPISEDI